MNSVQTGPKWCFQTGTDITEWVQCARQYTKHGGAGAPCSWPLLPYALRSTVIISLNCKTDTITITPRGLKIIKPGLPWWRSGWESACQRRGHGFEPWSGRIPHAAEQLGPWATITEPARLEPVLRNKRGRDSKRPAHRDEEWSPLATAGESPRTETKTQHSHK